VSNIINKSVVIKQLAKKLRLPVIAEYKKHIKTDLSFEENLENLLDIEYGEKEKRRIQRGIKRAGFPVVKTLDTFKPERLPCVKKEDIDELATCNFIEEKKNCIAIGNSGGGKTHLFTAIGVEAIKKGYTIKFRSASDIITQMSEAQDKKELAKYLKSINNCSVLIIDELGYISYDIKGANLLFQVLAARYETKSTMITTNLIFSKWVDFLGDEMLATALIDRLIHRSHILNMNVGSYRLEESEFDTSKLNL